MSGRPRGAGRLAGQPGADTPATAGGTDSAPPLIPRSGGSRTPPRRHHRRSARSAPKEAPLEPWRRRVAVPGSPDERPRRSSRQLRPTLAPTRAYDCLSRARAHPLAESVPLRPSPHIRLIGPLHLSPPRTFRHAACRHCSGMWRVVLGRMTRAHLRKGVYPPSRRSVRPSRQRGTRALSRAANTRCEQQKYDNPQTGGTADGAVIRCAALVTFL